MFATYYSHSMLPVNDPPAEALFSGYATPDGVHNERLSIKIPSRQTLVQARPKIGLRRSTFTPSPEQTMEDMPAQRVEPESPPPAPTASAPASPNRVYGRPRRPGASPRQGRRSGPGSPSAKSGSSMVKRVEVFESITCMPQLVATSFEELRLECYRLGFVTTGHAPMPVTPESAQWDTIPPFYSPFSQEALDSGFVPEQTDVAMTDESTGPWTFTFGVPDTSSEIGANMEF